MNDSFDVVVNPDPTLSQPSHMKEQRLQRTSEQFTVVEGGGNMIALHSTHHNRFLRLCHDGAVDRKGGSCDADKLPSYEEWPSERFHVVDCGDGQIALHSPCHNRFLRMVGDGTVDGNAGIVDYDKLPSDWAQERLKVVTLDLSNGRCVKTLTGHTQPVYSVIQLADGRVCSGSFDKTIKVWDLNTSQCVMTLTGHTQEVYSVIQLADGRVCSGSNDNTIKVWDLNTSQCAMTLTGHTLYVWSLIQLDDGRVCSGSADNTIKVWDLNTSQCVMTLTGHTQEVYSVIQLADGRVCSGSFDNTIKVWDLNTNQCVMTLTGHTQPVRSVIQLADGRVCSGSADKTIKV